MHKMAWTGLGAAALFAAAACDPFLTSTPTRAVEPVRRASGPPELRSLRVGATAQGHDRVLVTWEADVTNPGGAHAVLKLSGESVGQRPLRDGTGLVVRQAGDYRLVIEDENGASLGERAIMVRSVPCIGGQRRLMGATVTPAILGIGENRWIQLTIPRWDAHDRDHAYFVEWVHEGQVVFEDRGRHPSFDAIADRVESGRKPEWTSEVCGFSFGEVYDAPESGFLTVPGAWEVRVHREGQASIAAQFTVVPQGAPARATESEASPVVGEPVELRFRKIETPPRVAALLARTPTACMKYCWGDNHTVPTPPGKPRRSRVSQDAQSAGCGDRTPPLAHAAHSTSTSGVAGLPIPVLFSSEELRAMRSKDATYARWALNDAFYNGKTTIGRPGFAYDDNRSPVENFYAHRAWEAQDTQRQAAQESQARAGSLALVAPLRLQIQQYGAKPWTDDERPAPPEGLGY